MTSPQRNNSSRRIIERRNNAAGEIKKEPTSPILYPNESDVEVERYVSADSASQLTSSDEENEVMPSNLQDLMLQVRIFLFYFGEGFLNKEEIFITARIDEETLFIYFIDTHIYYY